MKKLIILILPLLIFSSCVTKKRCLNKFPPQQTQKTTIEIKERFQPVSIYFAPVNVQGGSDIVIQGDTISVKPSHLETKYAKSSAWIENMQLMHTLTQKKIQIDTVVIVKDKIVKDKIEKVVDVPVRGFFWWAGIIALVGIFGYVAIRLFVRI